MHRLLRKVTRTLFRYDPDYYDMYADPKEAYFGRLYLGRIRAALREAGLGPGAALVDAGCQTGRLAIPLARDGYRVTGIDTSAFALGRARRHARAAGVAVRWLRGDLLRLLRREPSAYDAALCAEVLYLSPRYREMLAVLRDAVRPGGLICVSHRPRWYYLVEALRAGDLDAAQFVATHGEGPFRDSRYYNWQGLEALRALYQELGLTVRAIHPIDTWAWLGGLERLSPATERLLAVLEEAPRSAGAERARYLLMVAQKQ